MANPWANIAHLSVSDFQLLQKQKLQHFIQRYVYPFSPYYRKLFDRERIDPRHIVSIEDLRKIPLASKNDFISSATEPEKFKDFIFQPDKEKIRQFWPAHKLIALGLASLTRGKAAVEEKISREFSPNFITFTTGTTNKPIPFFYSEYDVRNLYLSGARMLTLFGMKPQERAVNLFPYAPHLAFWQVVFGGLSSQVLILSTGGGKVMNSEGSIASIIKTKPTVILGVPSFVYHILRIAKDQKCDLSFVKQVVLGAARLSESFKAKLRSLLQSMGAKDVSIFGTYGFTEARSAWVECPTPAGISSGYHLYPDKEIFEIIDPDTGEVKNPGEDGELVYTALDGRGSIVLRYRTGDFVKGGISFEPCPYCKMTVPRVSSDITRLSDVQDLKLSKIKGTLVNLNHFISVLTDMPEIVEWQIEMKKKDNDPFEIDELVIYACPKDSVNKENLREKIKQEITQATEITPNDVVFLSLPEIVKRLELETANKERRILDSRPKYPK